MHKEIDKFKLFSQKPITPLEKLINYHIDLLDETLETIAKTNPSGDISFNRMVLNIASSMRTNLLTLYLLIKHLAISFPDLFIMDRSYPHKSQPEWVLSFMEQIAANARKVDESVVFIKYIHLFSSARSKSSGKDLATELQDAVKEIFNLSRVKDNFEVDKFHRIFNESFEYFDMLPEGHDEIKRQLDDLLDYSECLIKKYSIDKTPYLRKSGLVKDTNEYLSDTWFPDALTEFKKNYPALKKRLSDRQMVDFNKKDLEALNEHFNKRDGNIKMEDIDGVDRENLKKLLKRYYDKNKIKDTGSEALHIEARSIFPMQQFIAKYFTDYWEVIGHLLPESIFELVIITGKLLKIFDEGKIKEIDSKLEELYGNNDSYFISVVQRMGALKFGS